jgi:hypothetical protein
MDKDHENKPFIAIDGLVETKDEFDFEFGGNLSIPKKQTSSLKRSGTKMSSRGGGKILQKFDSGTSNITYESRLHFLEKMI